MDNGVGPLEKECRGETFHGLETGNLWQHNIQNSSSAFTESNYLESTLLILAQNLLLDFHL